MTGIWRRVRSRYRIPKASGLLANTGFTVLSHLVRKLMSVQANALGKLRRQRLAHCNKKPGNCLVEVFGFHGYSFPDDE